MNRTPIRALALFLSVSLSSAPLGAALVPAPESGFIGELVGRMLEKSHYSQKRLDDEISKQALRNYIDSFDYNHLIFDKADVDRFEQLYGASIDDRLRAGDVAPAYDIFNKLVEKLETRVEQVKKLAAEKQDFTKDENFLVDRHEAPWPANGDESQKIWRQRIKHELLLERLSKAKPEEQVKTVTVRYERLLRSVKEYDNNDILQTYLTAIARALDPHSDYLAAPSKENFDISMRLSLVGIGAVLRSEDGFAKIVSLVPGGPADVDKRLKPNDKIEAVAQGDQAFVEVVGMKLDRLVQMIRGEKGTKVRLRTIPADAVDQTTRVTVTLVRDEIKLTDQEAKAKVIDVPVSGRTMKLGVIDLPSFYADMKAGGEAKSTTRDVATLIGELKKQGIEGLIMDLRRNGGGSLTEAVNLTGLFIKDGPVVQIRDPRGDVKLLNDHDSSTGYAGPLVVLTGRMSASASEIFAAALQDYGRAVIVGEKSTFGKGTVQQMIELAQYLPSSYREVKPGALKLTIQKFYRVSGGTTQNRGVLPDIHLPSVSDYMDLTESSQKNALPYDEISPAPFSRIDSVSAYLSPLQKASSARVAASREFDYIRDDIEHAKKELKDKTVSLNEKKRLAEKEEDTARDEKRKKERLARKTPERKSADVTLQSIAGIKPPEPPAKSTETVASKDGKDGKDKDDYEKAPPAPDTVLDETLNVLGDLVNLANGGQAGLNGPETAVP
jgi:carboxyl-terminal processing protease